MSSVRVSRHARMRLVAAVTTVCALSAAPLAPLAPQAVAADAAPYSETYRPQFHFTPQKNWMNDPNGLVYHKGEYHLFYQYNPNGNSWGDMSWGHAVSKDLVHWEELPLALSHDDEEMVFSGSAVVDRDNTTGFGTKENPPMVAIYTSAYKDGGKQAQSLAYSTDRGRTWTKYQDNPVIDIGSTDFRDPKVQWHAPTKSWLMTVSLSSEHKVRFYSSKNLKDWELQSEFGPAGATGGVWECPDLFPLAVDGDRNNIKWVLVVNINPGGIAGGSAAQYFIGDFDGKKFTAEDKGTYTPPTGTVVQDFEGAGFGEWTTTGTAFGQGPAAGAVDGQGAVSGFDGKGLANSFHGGDGATGVLTSPTFTVDSPYLNFKIGGGRHPHAAGTVMDRTPPEGTVLADFEGGTYGDWTATGDAFGTAPATGALPGQQQVSGFLGDGLTNTFLNGDATTGTLTSPEFVIDKKHINFLIGGGNHPADSDHPTAVELLVDGQVVRSATGKDAESLDWASWDVSDLVGKNARFKIVDDNSGGWGHLNVDHVVLSDTKATPVSQETSVNLLVDGEVVRSATGADSENLDWASFDLRPYVGEKAQIQVVDMNTSGWGHVMADRFTAADKPAKSVVQRADWADYGKDYYAAVSWENAPGGKRYMIGWMNNWDYGQSVPTSPWRGAQSVPREMALRTVDGRIRLTSKPVGSLESLRRKRPVATAAGVSVKSTSKRLIGPTAEGRALDIEATFSLEDADRFGLKVRTGAGGEETVIGYDTTTQELYVDRTRSGAGDFNSTFPGVQTAPLKPVDGKVTLRILVDWSSVEVFGGSGEAAITDQIFPDPSSTGVEVFAEDGTATLDHLRAWQLRSIWR
ncbi:GH32 C-terminal domain-containing protein [Streptomyces sp. DSM 3412]|uniref:GH32 C-terminal domain-containing protein n=1 Tax=Streptomyces gottesmaniae TaxID=3075518 RepID=A0ABU2ZC05_9ACTN|nr:GH32 C-terminal domain-containing protein [Streptomyces sp. DSM 3412]MDT0574135.1 GH32 C-terminal domain-containing protein [Streptomyces sp. DSM 3412]